MHPKWLPGGLRGPSKSRLDLGPNKKVFFDAFWTPSWVPKNCLFRPRAAQKKSEVVFGKDFRGPRPFLKAFQHRAENGAAKKKVLDQILVPFCFMFEAFFGRQRTLARDQQILQTIQSPVVWNIFVVSALPLLTSSSRSPLAGC